MNQIGNEIRHFNGITRESEPTFWDYVAGMAVCLFFVAVILAAVYFLAAVTS